MHCIRNILCNTLIISTFFFSNAANLNNPIQKKNETEIASSSNFTFQKLVAENSDLPKQENLDKTHLSREHVMDKSAHILPNETEAKKNISETRQNSSNTKIKLVSEKLPEFEMGAPKKNDEKQSVPKKGVSFDGIDITPVHNVTNKTLMTSAVTVYSTKKPLPKKPSITEHDDVEFLPNGTKNKSDIHVAKVPSVEAIFEKKHNRRDYVVPIVAVILSVPLVAIIISVLYKRGTDWWQHRNYRRMDFLIEGMYNN